MPQEKTSEETELPELAPKPNLQADEPGGGGIGGSPRKPINLDDFPEDCGSPYGIDAKPRGRHYYGNH